MDLYDVIPGAVGQIYWYVNVHRELAEKEIDKIRQESITSTLNSTIMNMMYEPGKAINSMEGVIQRGWNDAKQRIEMLENGIDIKTEYVMVDERIKEQIAAIESSSEFKSWLNPILINQIKEI